MAKKRQGQRLKFCSHKPVSLKLPKAGRDKDRSSHRGFKGAWSCQPFDFGILASRTVRRDLLFKPTSVWLFVTTPPRTLIKHVPWTTHHENRSENSAEKDKYPAIKMLIDNSR